MMSDIIPVGGALEMLRPLGRGRQGLPLRVWVYGEIAGLIRDGRLPQGGQLPTEAELCEAFAVSRTVAREALILLEEDGLIRTVRGVGRFVADSLPPVGLERLQPVEQLFTRDGRTATVRGLRRTQEPSTDFTGGGLGLDAPAELMLWESIVLRDGEPACICQEWTFGEEALKRRDRRLHDLVRGRAKADASLATVFLERYGNRFGPGWCSIAVSNAGAGRAHKLGLHPQSPVLLLSQQVLVDGQPVYLGKHIVRPDAAHLSVVQSSQSPHKERA